jgi:hypothetical protein
MGRTSLAAIAVTAIALSSCGGGRFQDPNEMRERNVAIELLMGYDANGDQLLSRPEFENALRRDFATLDTNSDGGLDPIERGVENDRRWRAFGTGSTPLIDWNTDGFVDFNEFAATLRATFTQLDTDENDNLSTDELAVIEAPRAPPVPGRIERSPDISQIGPRPGPGPETLPTDG